MTRGVETMQERNNFDFLRLVAALLVLVSHQQALTGRPEWGIGNYQSLGGLGLLVFFTISGYLVCRSWDRDPNLIRFAIRRLLRIWPALAVMVGLTALVLGPLVTTMSASAYFADPLVWDYFEILRFKDAWHLPGLFVDHPSQAVNGSLWTLPIEVRWYAWLALAGLLGLIRWRVLLLACTIAMAIHYFWIFDVESVIASGGARHWKEELGLYFLAGASLYVFEPVWKTRQATLWLLVAVAALLSTIAGKSHASYWLCLSSATIAIARAAWPYVDQCGRHGDYSYGLYIYAFPVQQTVIAFLGPSLPFVAGLAWSLAITLVLAALSWHFVERPSLALKPRRGSTFGSPRRVLAGLAAIGTDRRRRD